MKEYFSHDYTAREDEKIKKLMFQHSWSGYGLYWGIIECLYQNDGYMELDYERIAFDMRTDKNIIDSIINDFDLFKQKANKFYSESVLKRLKQRKEKSDKARKSALSRWVSDKKTDANAKRTQSDSNANKVNKSKVNNSIHLFKNSEYCDNIPLIKQKIGDKYINYNLTYYHETVKNWSDSGGKMKKDWLATIRTFILKDINAGTVRLKK